MQPRLNHFELSSEFMKKFAEASQVKSSIPNELKHLVDIRASQINGCTFCLDMHIKEAKIHGERELKLHHISVWRESKLFSPKERATLEWTELVTNMTPDGISNEDYKRMLIYFTEKELSDLTYMVGFINVWNKLNVAFQNEHGKLDKMFGLDKAGLN